MIRRLYVIHDRVAEEAGPIFEAINDGIAHRNFKRFMSENTAKDHYFEELDFQLVHLGEIDKTTLIITPSDPHDVNVKISLIDEEQNDKSL